MAKATVDYYQVIWGHKVHQRHMRMGRSDMVVSLPQGEVEFRNTVNHIHEIHGIDMAFDHNDMAAQIPQAQVAFRHIVESVHDIQDIDMEMNHECLMVHQVIQDISPSMTGQFV